MAIPRVSLATIQTVHSGSSGATVRTPSTTVQVVHGRTGGSSVRAGQAVVQVVTSTASLAGAARVALSTVQIVTRSIAGAIRSAAAFVQAVHKGSIGAVVKEAHSTTQVVYTVGVADTTRQRAWTFDFDGHTFYVLDLGTSGSLVYDLATGQWSKFDTAGFSGHWNFKNGFHWRDGKMVVGGKIEGPSLQRIVADSFLDEGWRSVNYEVRGVLPVGGTDYRRQYTLRMIGSAGQLAGDISPVLRMQFSDDQGVTWSGEHSIALAADARQRIEFRSLGAFTAPGRIFRLYDSGGIKFIAHVEADMGGENGATPA